MTQPHIQKQYANASSFFLSTPSNRRKRKATSIVSQLGQISSFKRLLSFASLMCLLQQTEAGSTEVSDIIVRDGVPPTGENLCTKIVDKIGCTQGFLQENTTNVEKEMMDFLEENGMNFLDDNLKSMCEQHALSIVNENFDNEAEENRLNEAGEDATSEFDENLINLIEETMASFLEKNTITVSEDFIAQFKRSITSTNSVFPTVDGAFLQLQNCLTVPKIGSILINNLEEERNPSRQNVTVISSTWLKTQVTIEVRGQQSYSFKLSLESDLQQAMKDCQDWKGAAKHGLIILGVVLGAIAAVGVSAVSAWCCYEACKDRRVPVRQAAIGVR